MFKIFFISSALGRAGAVTRHDLCYVVGMVPLCPMISVSLLTNLKKNDGVINISAEGKG